MKGLFFSTILLFFSFSDSLNHTAIDLSGEWNITGSTQYGNLDYDWLIVDYDNEIEITKKSRYQNPDIKENVTRYSKSSNRVIIEIYENVGVGPTTHTYSLKIIDENTLKGTLEMESGEIGPLPSMTITSSIKMERK